VSLPHFTPGEPRYPLRINVGFIIKQPIGSSRDFHFEYPELRFDAEADEPALIRHFEGVVRIDRTPQGLFVQGEFRGEKTEECVRCLTQFWQPLQTYFDELFAFDHRSMSESGLLIPEEGIIDLAPLVREYLLIEVPIKPICRPDCKGLCPVCGENLNEVGCEHVPAGDRNHPAGDAPMREAS
jgi:uncharacterized protein